MGLDFRYRDKIPVGVLGATGIVGQSFVRALQDHPWFIVSALAGSERSIGKRYGDAVEWKMSTPLPEHLADIELKACTPDLPCSLIFSALDASVAGEIESQFAASNYYVVSNARNHRMDDEVPLIVPEVNASHLDLLKKEQKGFIVTCPNCIAGPLSLALKPLMSPFSIESVQVVTMQAASGAGSSGESAFSLLDNVIPFIEGEEEKVQQEPLKILGELEGNVINPFPSCISAQCNRAPVTDGHLISVSVKLEKKAKREDLIEAWREFQGEPQGLELPTAPLHPIHFVEDKFSPQPRFHRHQEDGMSIVIGQLKECSVQDFRFVILSHNMIRGAVGGSLLTAELLAKKGYIFW